MTNEIDRMQGTWRVVALETEGQPMAQAMLAEARIVVSGDRFTSLGMGAIYGGTLVVDASATPRRLDLVFDRGPEQGSTNLANAVAALAAQAGLDAYILVPADLERTKIYGTAVYGAKVIAVSGKMTDEEAKGLLASGFDGFLRKPFHVRQVIEAVEDAVAVVY